MNEVRKRMTIIMQTNLALSCHHVDFSRLMKQYVHVIAATTALSVCNTHLLLAQHARARLHHPQQTPIRHLFTPAESQDHQALQVGRNGAHRQVGHVDARGQVQFT